MALFRNLFTIGFATGLSRILGFVRDILVASSLGTGVVADAFVVAFRLPNLFRRVFGEGAFNSAFIPLFTKKLHDGERDARLFMNETYSGLAFILLIMTLVFELFMPFVVWIMAPGFVENPEKYELTVIFTRICFPYLMCMSLGACLGGILNGQNRFAATAYAPVVLNLVLIPSLLLAELLGYAKTPTAGIILVWGVFIAGFAQFGLLAYATWRVGYLPRFQRPRWTPNVKRLLQLGVPGVIAGGIAQVNIIVGTMIASQTPGAVSYLYYADRLYQLPLGVVGIAMGMALLPDIARRIHLGDKKGARIAQAQGLEASLLLTVPCAVALGVLSEPIIRVLFEHGAFTAHDTRQTAQALTAFAIGLPSFVLVKVFSPSFFAREDTKTPMIYGLLSVVVNIIVSLMLFPTMQHVGIAIATSVAGWLNVILLVMGLVQRRFARYDRDVYWRALLIMVASSLMGLACYGLVSTVLAPYFLPESSYSQRIPAMATLVLSGVFVYAALLHLMGAYHLGDARKLFQKPRVPDDAE